MNDERSIAASRRVIDRRNMFVHDAILKQSVEIEQIKWLSNVLGEIPEEIRDSVTESLFKRFQIGERLKRWESLPDLSWYVRDRSRERTRNLLRDFFVILDEKRAKLLKPMTRSKNVVLSLAKFPRLVKSIKESLLLGEADFIRHSAKGNLEDVKTVLEHIYEDKIFTF